MRRCVSDFLTADNAVPPIYGNTGFIAERRYGDVHRLAAVSCRFGFGELHVPTCLRVFLRGLGGVVQQDFLGGLACIYLSFLVLSIALPRRAYQRCIDDLA